MKLSRNDGIVIGLVLTFENWFELENCSDLTLSITIAAKLLGRSKYVPPPTPSTAGR